MNFRDILCVFPECPVTMEHAKIGVTFHKFPKDERYAIRWMRVVRAVRNDDRWKPRKWNKVCSMHFTYEELYYDHRGRRVVHHTALPKQSTKMPMEGASVHDGHEDSDLEEDTADQLEVYQRLYNNMSPHSFFKLYEDIIDRPLL